MDKEESFLFVHVGEHFLPRHLILRLWTLSILFGLALPAPLSLWASLLQSTRREPGELTQLARHTIARRFHGEPVDFPAAGSLAQVYRMRLAVSLQRSMARALHLRAGRALAAASGSGQGTHFQEPSISDLRLLSRVPLLGCAAVTAMAPAPDQAALAALEALQAKIDKLAAQQAAEKLKLGRNFLEQCKTLYERRRKIINGEVEPTDEEVGEVAKLGDAPLPTLQKQHKGIPYFWLSVLKNQDTISEYVKRRDEPALVYLQDIQLIVPREAPGYRVEFLFRPNPYFHDKVLSKEVHFAAAGEPLQEAIVQESTPIRWKNLESNLTLRQVIKQVKKGKAGKVKRGGDAPVTTKSKPCQSFFNFFSVEDPFSKKEKRKGQADAENDDEDDEGPLLDDLEGLELEDAGPPRLSESHQEILVTLWQEVVPSAVDLFSADEFLAQEGKLGSTSDDDYEQVGAAGDQLGALPPSIARRVQALQTMQLELRNLKDEQAMEVDLLQTKFESLCVDVFRQRKTVVMGKTEGQMAVPRFWLLALKACPSTVELIRRRDEPVLASLMDISVRRQSGVSFSIDFQFTKNEYFTNDVLSKAFHMGGEGEGLLSTTSTSIQWLPGKNITVKDPQAAHPRACASFFHLFNERGSQLLFAGDERVSLSAVAIKDQMEALAVALRDSIVTQTFTLYKEAAQWDLGEGLDSHSEDEDAEDDEDEEDDPSVDNISGRQRPIGKSKKKRKEDGTAAVCCGMSQSTGLILIAILVLAPQVFLLLDMFANRELHVRQSATSPVSLVTIEVDCAAEDADTEFHGMCTWSQAAISCQLDPVTTVGSQWLDLLARLARRSVSPRSDEPADINAAGSWAQVYRVRLSVSLQRSMAHALHLRAGRALAAASGFRQQDSFPAASLSDLRLLTRKY
eukprot:SM000058S18536  [mRNA]  locus=s58:470200:475719:+ [translate_table: standard]